MRNASAQGLICAQDVAVTVGRETIECAVIVGYQRIRFRYSGYTRTQAVREFVAYVNAGGI